MQVRNRHRGHQSLNFLHTTKCYKFLVILVHVLEWDLDRVRRLGRKGFYKLFELCKGDKFGEGVVTQVCNFTSWGPSLAKRNAISKRGLTLAWPVLSRVSTLTLNSSVISLSTYKHWALMIFSLESTISFTFWHENCQCIRQTPRVRI